jgi:DNA-binding HxlR family transcriptional regulator
MRSDHRSGCPINLTLEVLGDKWSLLIIRDMIFGNRRHFRELLQKSDEGIASNILAVRLKRLVEQGIITRSSDPTHKQKGIYSLTEQGIELVPVLAQMAGWGRKFFSGTDAYNGTKSFNEGDARTWGKFMAELRALHLTAGARRQSRAAAPRGTAARTRRRPTARTAARSRATENSKKGS